jgi:RNA:NAD 2'-phosphotransferase (TPT1/KptA family)
MPVVLRVDAGTMHSNEHAFIRAANGFYLTEKVPPSYLDFGVM